ncbi:unnamed protein product, partial [Discosporangium mesarthrocarpum]
SLALGRRETFSSEVKKCPEVEGEGIFFFLLLQLAGGVVSAFPSLAVVAPAAVVVFTTLIVDCLSLEPQRCHLALLWREGGCWERMYFLPLAFFPLPPALCAVASLRPQLDISLQTYTSPPPFSPFVFVVP